ncbi:MAG: recombination regulator RecX [Rhodocyclaceae bacterium]|nr:recombination regulator RecX [Rhodocyclaceae bacterium]
MNELRQRAIRLLARREHTRAELAGKLAALGTQEEIDAVLAELAQTGLLSDARYAEAYLRTNAARFGGARLRQALRRKGIAGELIEAQLAESDAPDELARARAVWSRKFSAPPADAKEWARQARFLQSRGFASDIIRKLLKEPSP